MFVGQVFAVSVWGPGVRSHNLYKKIMVVHTCILALGGGEGRTPDSPFRPFLSSGSETLFQRMKGEEDVEEEDADLCPHTLRT